MTVEKTVDPLLYSVNSLGINTEEQIVSSLEDEIKTRRLNSAGIDPKKLKAIEPHISLSTKELSKEGSSEKDTSTGAATAAGYIAGFLIYMFIFIYGSMVMRGVVEEKTNRIIEIIISTIKPFHLMMGKVLGISAVAVVQLIMWVVFTMAITSGASIVMGLMMDKDQIAQVASSGNPVEMNGTISSETKEKIKATSENRSADMFAEVNKAAATINVPLIVACFLFYFIGGYLVYAGLFAAIGSAVDSETDAQQLTGPISIPLIIGFIASQVVIQNPDSGFGIALSLFPLTSPITMMMRIPFGVPTWQLITSMVLLVATFIGTIWLSGRIFRVGILLFGKKPTWKQMIIWVFRKD
jgi:ABC-2 type transport system permease protein